MPETVTEYKPKAAFDAISHIGAEMRKAKTALERANRLYNDLEDMQDARPDDQRWALTEMQKLMLDRACQQAPEVRDLAELAV